MFKNDMKGLDLPECRCAELSCMEEEDCGDTGLPGAPKNEQAVIWRVRI